MQHMREFLPNTLRIDFVGRRGFFALMSLVAVVVSVALFVIVGPNYGIDFTGGVEVQARFGVATRIEEVRAALVPLGVEDEAVVQLGDAADARFLVRVQGESGARPEVIDAVKAGVVAAFGADRLDLFEPETEVGTRIRMLLKGDAVGVEAVQAAVRAVDGVRVQLGTEPNAFYIRLPGVAEAVSSAL
jgi:preprotein translocase subunit SecF